MSFKPWNQRRFLYINDRLYRKIAINKSEDLYTAMDTETGDVVTFSYMVVRDTHKMAYTTTEVGEFLGRKPRSIRQAISDGAVVPKKQSYNTFKGKQKTALGPVTTNTGRCEYYFKPEEVMEMRDYFATGKKVVRHKNPVPTKTELKAMMEQNVVLYVKSKDGSFLPTWKAIEF